MNVFEFYRNLTRSKHGNLWLMLVGFGLVIVQYFLDDTTLNFYVRVGFLACVVFLFFISPLINNLSMLGVKKSERNRNKLDKD
jgi:hypothetical protein